jgi:hypothetical protein
MLVLPRFENRSRPLSRTGASLVTLGAALVLLAPARADGVAGAGAPAAETPVLANGAIIVRGNRRIDAEAIREHFKGPAAARLEPKVVNDALKELYGTGLLRGQQQDQGQGPRKSDRR